MTRQSLNLKVLVFLMVFLFPITAFSSNKHRSNKHRNFRAEIRTDKEIKDSINGVDFAQLFKPLRPFKHFKNPQGKFGSPMQFNISEEAIFNIIRKLFKVDALQDIMKSESEEFPFMGEWMPLFSSMNMGDELVVDFKNAGIFNYDDGVWSNIYNGGLDPVSMVSFNYKLAADFGHDYGIFVYDSGNWTKIYYGVEVEKMAGLISKLVVDFGISYGIYEYNYQTDEWTKIYSKYGAPRDSLISFGDKLVADFKTAGIYIYDDEEWDNIYNGGIDPVSIVSFDGKLAVDFGPENGIYVYEYGTDTWVKIYTGMTVEKMVGFDKYLAVDFGTAYGLHVYEYDTDTWTEIYKGFPIEKLSGLSDRLVIDFGINYGIYEYTFSTDTWNKIYHASVLRDDICSSDVFD